ncbi:MAG: hypothetical protein GWP10_13580, partial [Nitrospiraceae bacterium]|nr:hypothetical protein [Nitrospiraceae bacterium]
DNHETTTDNSTHIAIDGQGNTIIITGDSATIAPKPNDVETCSPAQYNCASTVFTVPNVEIVDANGTKTEFVEVIFKIDPATGELKLLYASQ